MMNKTKVFYNYLSSKIFALLLNSYIWKLTFYHSKTLFYYMANNTKFIYNYQSSENFAFFYWMPTYEDRLFTI